MPLIEQSIITTNTILYAQDGTPMAGAKMSFQLDRDDLDVASGSAVHASKAPQYIALDADGKLPSGFALWANSRGVKGSRWLLGFWYGTECIQSPISVRVVENAQPLELATLLTGGVQWPQ